MSATASLRVVDEQEREQFRLEARRDFGVSLRRERKAAGLTQEGLAEKAELHRTHIGLLERGKRTPELTTILLLAGALDIAAGRFFESDGAAG
jgi:transcriptional regulator with XRE-family HTH domain